MDSYELDNFYGRGTSLHIGLDAAFKQFDHELKRKSLLVVYSNGVSQSKDTDVLKVASKYPGPGKSSQNKNITLLNTCKLQFV